ncbi:DUF998 domain-containing protein [Nocardia sp. NPDC052254]|uniref:DUF998 domain-containing protein n=1 Tax=Nocardia sp. NPDC052254 TaxID=3155681 RepID=UPI003441F01C
MTPRQPATDDTGPIAVMERKDAPARGRFRIVRSLIAAAVAIAGICYSSWILEFVLPIHLNPVTSFLSELDAEGRPYRWVFDLGDTVSGSLIVVSAVAALFVFSRRRLWVVAWVALGCFGAATIADAQWPLHTCSAPCPPSDSGLFPQLHQIHALTSSLAVISIFVSMIAFSVAAFRYRRWPILRHSGLWILVIGSTATAWMMIADNLAGNFALGIAQRIQVGSMSLWLIALAVQIWVAERVSASAP